jgi:predicted ATPase/class 3 adenylate cyclase
VTFVFTDLEGSTALLEAHPAAYREAVRRHHALLRDAVEAQGGAVFETVGDAVYAAFASPAAAVAAALDGQRALRAEAWGATGELRARMGVHLGEVERQGAHYFGAPLYRCARLTAAAHGGQTVLSGAAAALVRDALPAGAGLLDLGEHRLKDLATPERVFQLLHRDLPAAFPPLRSLDARPHNLPLQVTGFVGREGELAAVARLLAGEPPGPRLVTLTGPGGCGKTRLALQAAAEVLDAHPDGVWLVELGALADPALVPQAVAAAVGVREAPGRPLLATLTDALRPKRLLVVLDNCEHLLDACARLADALLRTCPHVRVLATSREALGIAGETAWRVPSLPVPAAAGAAEPGPDVAGLARYAAVRLFADRAAAVRPGFALTPDNAAAVAEICARLDGIPLALELAAARVRVLPPQQLLARLEDRFRLLTGGSRAALERHQTLRAAVDWSYALLTAPEQALFARLSAFGGGWTLEAAEAVCAGGGVEAAGVLDLLTALVDKSLVVADEQEGEARYRLLETIRQYALERLRAAEGEAAVRRRHMAYFLALAERAAPELGGPRPAAWLDRLTAEHDNLRAALDWSFEAPDTLPDAALRLAGALSWFWWLRGHRREGRDRLEAALARAGPAAPAARAEALRGAGRLTTEGGDPARARALLDESVALSRALGDRRGLMESLILAAYPRRRVGEYPYVRRLFAEALTLARGLGDPWLLGCTLATLAWTAAAHHDDATARAAGERSLPLLRQAGDQQRLAWAYRALGDVALRQGDLDGAAAAYAEDLARARFGAGAGVLGLYNLGEVARRRGRHAEARAHFEEALALTTVRGAGPAAWIRWSLGTVALQEGDPARAAAQYAAGLRLFDPDPARLGGLVAHGGVVLCLAGLARARAAQGAAAAAARLSGAADAHAPTAGARLAPDDRAAYERDLAAVRAALGEAAFAAARAAGHTMTLERAVTCALEDDRGG